MYVCRRRFIVCCHQRCKLRFPFAVRWARPGSFSLEVERHGFCIVAPGLAGPRRLADRRVSSDPLAGQQCGLQMVPPRGRGHATRLALRRRGAHGRRRYGDADGADDDDRDDKDDDEGHDSFI